MCLNDLTDIIATLITNNFHIYKVDRISPENIIIDTYKIDKLGAKIKYSLLFSLDNEKNATIIKILIKNSESYESFPIYINDNYSTDECSSYTQKEFFDFFGG